MMEKRFEQGEALGFRYELDRQLGQLSVHHDGCIGWDQLQLIKNLVWGEDAVAIEVYPPQRDVVNSGNYRHLWRLGEHDFYPDLLDANRARDTLENRFDEAWRGARHG